MYHGLCAAEALVPEAFVGSSATQPQEHPPQTGGIPVTLHGSGKCFGTRQVLHPLRLHIEAGEFVSIVGRSGCGKSTLLRLLAGLDTPSVGHIDKDSSLHTRIMFQEARLLPWKSVLANVVLGLPTARASDALAALAQVGLADRAHDWPSTLSGGQRQRVALARALLHRPRLLLLDEPLGALDALTRLEMQQLIVQLWQQHGFTCVLVTHDVQEAVTLAQRVLLIEAGRIALDTPMNLPYPRQRSDSACATLEAALLQRLLHKAE